MYIALNFDQKWRNNSDRCNFRLVNIYSALLLHSMFTASPGRFHTRESILHLINANNQILKNLVPQIARNTSLVQIVSIFISVNVFVGWCLTYQPIGLIFSYGFINCGFTIIMILWMLLALVFVQKAPNFQDCANVDGPLEKPKLPILFTTDNINMQKKEDVVKMTVMFQHKVDVS